MPLFLKFFADFLALSRYDMQMGLQSRHGGNASNSDFLQYNQVLCNDLQPSFLAAIVGFWQTSRRIYGAANQPYKQ